MNDSPARKYVADAAVFIMGGTDISPSGMISVPAVEDEMVSEDARLRYDLAIADGLRIEAPLPEMIDAVRARAAATRDIDVLSETDLAVLAKALEHKDMTLLTDDFAVQNVAAKLGLCVRPVAQRTIRDKIVWQKQCIGCGRHFDHGDDCPVCGSPLRRKMKRRSAVKTPVTSDGKASVASLFRKKE